MSELKDLFTALSKFQGELKPVAKSAENPFFKSSYADLSSVWESIRAPLIKNGLSVIQTTKTVENRLVLMTMLCHSSGQHVVSEYPVNPVKSDPQGLGSAMTYARRYSLMAIIGQVAADEDDDGNHASGNAPKPQAPQPPPRQQIPRPATVPQPTAVPLPLRVPHPKAPAAAPASKYVIPFGKFQGKTFDKLSRQEIVSYVDYLEAGAQSSGEGLSEKAQEFIEKAMDHLDIQPKDNF